MQGIESKAWYYNEFQQVGVDFESLDEVRRYDEEIGKGINQRDVLAELVEAIGLKPTDTVLEIGTATGKLAMALAPLCRQVYAIDISGTMLAYAREKAAKQGLGNIEFIRAGFLSYHCVDSELDAIITKMSLHHLPDHWKAIALKRLCNMLKPGGKLYLKDAMFSVEVGDFSAAADSWISSTREESGDRPADAVVTFIRDEYPTYYWIMEGLLKRAGFHIDRANTLYDLHTTFVCSKPL